MTHHVWILLSAPPKNKGTFYIHSITVTVKRMNHFLVLFQSREFLKNTASWSQNTKLKFKGARTRRPAVYILCCWWLSCTQPSANMRGADRQDGGKSQLLQQLRLNRSSGDTFCGARDGDRQPQAADPVALARSCDLRGAAGQRQLPLFRKRQDLTIKASSPLVLSSTGTTHQGKMGFCEICPESPTIPGPWAAVGTLGKTCPLQRVCLRAPGLLFSRPRRRFFFLVPPFLF